MKRLLVLAISCLVYVGTEIGHSFARAMGERVPSRCVVLLYHGMPKEVTGRFAKQLDILGQGATPVAADCRVPLQPLGDYVAVTFDDGLISFVDNALPELQRRRIPVTLFVVVGRLGAVPAWTRYSSETTWTSASSVPTGERMLTAEELKRLKGKVLIGSHSLTHARLADLDADKLEEEVEGSRRQLERIMGEDVTLFSFPYGAFSQEVLNHCHGYRRVFTIEPTLAFSDPEEFVSGRVAVDPTDWSLEFWLKLKGCYRWLPYAVAAKRKLRDLLRVHGFSSSPETAKHG
ncbi:MAG: polysaccharide deacetylase family protein [Acidobacteria bacterium]|nr:polysaccharide deacetylase family protein [Acidobacteriota bacterium]